jgi:hypothetical protein
MLKYRLEYIGDCVWAVAVSAGWTYLGRAENYEIARRMVIAYVNERPEERKLDE